MCRVQTNAFWNRKKYHCALKISGKFNFLSWMKYSLAIGSTFWLLITSVIISSNAINIFTFFWNVIINILVNIFYVFRVFNKAWFPLRSVIFRHSILCEVFTLKNGFVATPNSEHKYKNDRKRRERWSMRWEEESFWCFYFLC